MVIGVEIAEAHPLVMGHSSQIRVGGPWKIGGDVSEAIHQALRNPAFQFARGSDRRVEDCGEFSTRFGDATLETVAGSLAPQE
jgi:hypothetical protein